MPGPGTGQRAERGYWDSIDASHRRSIVLAVALTAVAVAVGAGWLLLRACAGTPERDIGGGAKLIGGPAAELPTGSMSATTAASRLQTPSAATTAPAAASKFTRAPKVAYRKDGRLWVADEDGSGAGKVAEAAMGSFALSPDGRTLAYEDAAHVLRLVPVAGGAARSAGAMSPGGRLVWAPSSAWLAFETAGGVRRADRDGSAGSRLASGSKPAVSPDGAKVAFLAQTAPGAYQVKAVDARGGAESVLWSEPVPRAVAWLTATRIVCLASSGSPSAGSGAWTVDLPAGAPTRVATEQIDAPADPSAIAMCASPDGRHVSWAGRGDDGYSRTMMLDTQTSRVVPASKRYDTYPLCWSADGKRLFLIEGNAWQGESTRLVSISADGADKRVIVEGAGL